MKELTIQVDGVLGISEWKVRIKPKNERGWDMWSYGSVWNNVLGKNEQKWRKKTRGNKYLVGETLEGIITNLLTCGDYTRNKTLLSIRDI